jgi:hypothetical protein
MPTSQYPTFAERYPVLTHKLPPKRKPWESEHHSMSIFEALTVAEAYGGGNVPTRKAAMAAMRSARKAGSRRIAPPMRLIQSSPHQ